MRTMLRPRRALTSAMCAAVLATACAPAARTADGSRDGTREEHTARTRGGMVVSANIIASEAGAQVLRDGGNAVDAAIATGLALAVVHPTAGNIGGGGFMIIRFPDGTTTALDFREKAPLRAHPEMFVDPATGEYSSRIHHNSHIAVGVPGTVSGFDYAHRKYGRADWSSLVEPSVTLARDGFPLSPALARSFESVLRTMQDYPASIAAFSNNGTPWPAGHVWQQPDLAGSLDRIRTGRSNGFYAGRTAELLVAEMARGGGMITLEDLALYQPREMTPVTGTYRGYDVISMAPPSSGGIAMVEMLNILEGFDLRAMGHNTAPYIHHLTEAMRRAYRDRAQYVADPEFADVPVARLTSKEHATRLRSTIDPNRATVSTPSDLAMRDESDETTHYSVVDADGMAVSVTYTLEAGYGSKIVVPGAGFLLNNEMGDFNARQGLTTETGLVGTEPNLARPQQRMISSMTPTILARDGELVAVFGSPGGRTIINTVMQVLLNIVDHRMDIDDAVAAKRLHHQWLPDRLSIEADGATEAALDQLRAMGHDVRVISRQGSVHAIMIDPRTRERVAAADRRDADAGAAAADGRGGTGVATLAPTAIDSVRLMRDISVLAHDTMEGRRVGTAGSARARAFLERSFRELGLQPVGSASYLHPFTFTRNDSTVTGVNVVGQVRGSARPEQYIVITAHYDHLGIRNGEIFNGADDNASGTAAVLALADWFTDNPPRHTIIFAAFDAEEGGLRGAHAFVANPPVARDAIVLNVNMDMVGRNDAGELYVAGTRHYPQLLPFVQRVAANAEVTLIPGHDSPVPQPSDDWTMASDHGAFHRVGIPFLYFGVEDHPDYHRPTDVLSGIQPRFYNRAVRTILSVVRLVDADL